MNRLLKKKYIFLVLPTLFVFFGQFLWADDLSEVQKELSEIQENLQKIENSLEKNLLDYESIKAETTNLDRQIGRMHKHLQDSKSELLTNQKNLVNLQEEQKFLEQKFTQQSKQYKYQLLAAYSLHSQSKWKFLLSQKSFQNVGRNAVIYDYLHDAQKREITGILELSEQIGDNQEALSTQQNKLEMLVNQQTKEHSLLTEMREQKQKAQSHLIALIEENKVTLSQELDKQKALQKLLFKLEKQKSEVALGKFSGQSGQLPWPVQGKPDKRFGESKDGIAGVELAGVVFNATRGTEINAIFPGKVVFADWFDHYGWLIIIDHGDEFMSLYAHAEGLYKNVGDYVTQGELIAVVGDSGDTDRTQLYFEIRRQGAPVDPAKWCVRS